LLSNAAAGDASRVVSLSDAEIAQDDAGLRASISGRPSWTSAEYARVAQERGHARALLEGYRRFGSRVLDHLGGAFALVAVDSRRRRLLAAVDRMGQCGLYYRVSDTGLYFSSSLNRLVELHGERPELDPQAVYDYIYFHVIAGPRTIWAGHAKLGRAQLIEFDASTGTVDVRRYWLPEFAARAEQTIPLLKDDLMRSLSDAVATVCPPVSGSVACFLSGGLDSSTVAGLLATQHGGDKVDAFSIGFSAAGYDEREFARITAKHFRVRHHEYCVTPHDVAESAPRIAAFFEQPFGNSSAVPVYHCAKIAREAGMAQICAGDGGDEIFAGNAQYRAQLIFNRFAALPSLVRSATEVGVKVSSKLLPFWPFTKAASYIAQARLPLPDRLQTYNFLHRNDPAQFFDPAFLATIERDEPLRALRAEYAVLDSRSIVDRLLYLDWKFVLQDNDLCKVGRMCEMAGIDVLYPMLEDRLVEFSCSIPGRLKMRGSRLRWFYREAMRGFLPEAILAKGKHGFGLPFGIWLRDEPELESLASASLDSLGRRGIIRADFIERTWSQFRAGSASYYGELIWILMMLELWLQCRKL